MGHAYHPSTRSDLSLKQMCVGGGSYGDDSIGKMLVA